MASAIVRPTSLKLSDFLYWAKAKNTFIKNMYCFGPNDLKRHKYNKKYFNDNTRRGNCTYKYKFCAINPNRPRVKFNLA